MKPTRLICDAGPLILLAKLDRLHDLLLDRTYPPVILACVAKEVLRGPFEPGEKNRLQHVFQEVPPVSHEYPAGSEGSLSVCDLACLRYTENDSGSWLLADDRLLRRAARAAGCPVIGFPGLLLKSVSDGRLPPTVARELLNRAISDHGYRISIRLYQELLQTLSRLSSL